MSTRAKKEWHCRPKGYRTSIWQEGIALCPVFKWHLIIYRLENSFPLQTVSELEVLLNARNQRR